MSYKWGFGVWGIWQRERYLYCERNNLIWLNISLINFPKVGKLTEITCKISRQPITSLICNSNYHKFNANPLKIYRREIASQSIPNCNFRTSASVDIFNQPKEEAKKEKEDD